MNRQPNEANVCVCGEGGGGNFGGKFQVIPPLYETLVTLCMLDSNYMYSFMCYKCTTQSIPIDCTHLTSISFCNFIDTLTLVAVRREG